MANLRYMDEAIARAQNPTPKRAKRDKLTSLDQAAFDEAYASLPDTANQQEEWDWVRVHPAMMYADRMAAKDTTKVIIRAEDILDPPHGCAPSKAAVSLLQCWVNNAKEFHKLYLTKKTTADTKSGEVVADPDIAEVERLLKEVLDGIRAEQEQRESPKAPADEHGEPRRLGPSNEDRDEAAERYRRYIAARKAARANPGAGDSPGLEP